MEGPNGKNRKERRQRGGKKANGEREEGDGGREVEGGMEEIMDMLTDLENGC